MRDWYAPSCIFLTPHCISILCRFLFSFFIFHVFCCVLKIFALPMNCLTLVAAFFANSNSCSADYIQLRLCGRTLVDFRGRLFAASFLHRPLADRQTICLGGQPSVCVWLSQLKANKVCEKPLFFYLHPELLLLLIAEAPAAAICGCMHWVCGVNKFFRVDYV